MMTYASDSIEDGAGRAWSAKRGWNMSRFLVMTVFAVLFAPCLGCVENEQTFFIEHVKKQPEGPDCTVTAGDAYIFRGGLDVFFDSPYIASVLVTNHIASRESYESGRAESSGIYIDYAESYVLVNGELVGERAREPLEHYLEPESSKPIAVTMIPYGALYDLQVELNCPPLGIPTPTAFRPEPALAVVRLFGHTAGGKEVQTQELSFPIEYCCGCLINWNNCRDECSKFCEDLETVNGLCYPGVANGTSALPDCRVFFHDPNATWPCAQGQCSCEDC
jgi:hypothetical protein